MAAAFPFTAIVGQEEMKRALILAAIDPRIGGVLVMGDRGTGKSTIVRSLAALLPPLETSSGCRFNCDPVHPDPACLDQCATSGKRAASGPVPVVDLPLGATEDRIVGALDLERALTRGEKAYEPGLLARANRGFLYIDEVNLLEDHLVDLLIDVAASGENVVEREGLSVRHAARFVLIGSGNPEEGELRPQLLDRFGLCVEVTTPTDIASRVEIVRRRDTFERQPEAFAAQWAGAQAALQVRVEQARARAADVVVSDAVLERAAELCIKLGTDGVRGELTLVRAARALAALEGRAGVSDADLRAVATSALRHRLRRDPLDEAGSSARVERAVSEIFIDAPPAAIPTPTSERKRLLERINP